MVIDDHMFPVFSPTGNTISGVCVRIRVIAVRKTHGSRLRNIGNRIFLHIIDMHMAFTKINKIPTIRRTSERTGDIAGKLPGFPGLQIYPIQIRRRFTPTDVCNISTVIATYSVPWMIRNADIPHILIGQLHKITSVQLDGAQVSHPAQHSPATNLYSLDHFILPVPYIHIQDGVTAQLEFGLLLPDSKKQGVSLLRPTQRSIFTDYMAGREPGE